MDIEDAHKLKLLSFDETEDLLLGFFDSNTRRHICQRVHDEGVTDENEKVVYMRACAIGKLENECVKTFVENEESILNGTFEGSLIDHISPLQHDAYKRCTTISTQKIYNSKIVLDVELSGYKIMETLMQDLVEAAVHRISSIPNSLSAVFRHNTTFKVQTLKPASWQSSTISAA